MNNTNSLITFKLRRRMPFEPQQMLVRG